MWVFTDEGVTPKYFGFSLFNFEMYNTILISNLSHRIMYIYFFLLGISAAVVKEMKKVCDSLKSFSISYEQIFKVDLFSALPATLTHLSLPYCNLSLEHFKTILSSGKS